MRKNYTRVVSAIVCAAMLLVNLRYDVFADQVLGASTASVEKTSIENNDNKQPESLENAEKSGDLAMLENSVGGGSDNTVGQENTDSKGSENTDKDNEGTDNKDSIVNNNSNDNSNITSKEGEKSEDILPNSGNENPDEKTEGSSDNTTNETDNQTDLNSQPVKLNTKPVKSMLLGSAAPTEDGWDEEHKYYYFYNYTLSNTSAGGIIRTVDCRVKSHEGDIFGWVDSVGKEHWFKDDIFDFEEKIDGEYVLNGYCFGYGMDQSYWYIDPIYATIANCNVIGNVGTGSYAKHGHYTKDSSLTSETEIIFPDTSCFCTSRCFFRENNISGWNNCYPVVTNVEKNNKTTIELPFGAKIKVYSGDAYRPKDEGGYVSLGKVYFVGNNANINAMESWVTEEYIKQNYPTRSYEYQLRQFDAVTYIPPVAAEYGYTLFQYNGENYEYNNYCSNDTFTDKDGEKFKLNIYEVKKWNDNTGAWEKLNAKYCLNLSDSVIVPLTVDDLQGHSYTDFANYSGYEYIYVEPVPEGFYVDPRYDFCYWKKCDEPSFFERNEKWYKGYFFQQYSADKYQLMDGSHYFFGKVNGLEQDGVPQANILTGYRFGDNFYSVTYGDIMPSEYANYGFNMLTDDEIKSEERLNTIISSYHSWSGTDDGLRYQFKEHKSIPVEGGYEFRFDVYTEKNTGKEYVGECWTRSSGVQFEHKYFEGFEPDGDFYSDFENLTGSEIVSKYYDEIDEGYIEVITPKKFLTENDEYGLMYSYSYSIPISDGTVFHMCFGVLWDKENGEEIEGLFELDEDNYLIAVYPFTDELYDELFESITKEVALQRYGNCYEFYEMTERPDVEAEGYEIIHFICEWGDEYDAYVKSLNKPYTLYGADYKVEFSNTYDYQDDETWDYRNIRDCSCVKMDMDANDRYCLMSMSRDGYEFIDNLEGNFMRNTQERSATWLMSHYEVDAAGLKAIFEEVFPDGTFSMINEAPYSPLPFDPTGYEHGTYVGDYNDIKEIYYKPNGKSCRNDFQDGYLVQNLYDGYWTDGNSWYSFYDRVIVEYEGRANLGVGNALCGNYGSVGSLNGMDMFLGEEYGAENIEHFITQIMVYKGLEVHRYDQVPTGPDIINVDSKTYYKVKSENALFKQFSDGKVTGKVYTKYTYGMNHRYNEDKSVLYLVKGDGDRKYVTSIPSTYPGSYADACAEYGKLEEVFECKYEGGSVDPAPTPAPTPAPKEEEQKPDNVVVRFIENIIDELFGRDNSDEENSNESSGSDSSSEGTSDASGDAGQMKGTGSQSGWSAVERAITPANVIDGTYTIWGSKKMSVPNNVIDKMNSEKVMVANFALTPKTMFSMYPSMKKDADFGLSIDARCWNDNIQYKDDAPSVPMATVMQNGGTIMSDVLTVRCSGKDVNQGAVITCSKLLPKAKNVTLYVYNPTNNTLVPYKSLAYGNNTTVQFLIPCVSATYVIIEN